MKKLSLLLRTLLTLYLFLPLPAQAAPDASAVIHSLEAKLERWDVEDIWPEVTEALSQYPGNAELMKLASGIAYYRGDYPEALALIKQSLAAGGEEEERKGLMHFIAETIAVLGPYKRYESPHFIVTLDEGQDGILVDYLTSALEKTYDVMAAQYGFQPKEKIRVELFPDASAFYRASALSVRDIEVTGAVGLTKFNKLQFLSPRALVHGYRWLDAISHEYLHYLIMKLTRNRAPIWFHEGLAKYEETRWRNGPDYLSPLSRTLLSQALEEDKLIGFERMEPSLLQLETPTEVQLAYAQSASAIEFIIKTSGYEGLKKVMHFMALSKTGGATASIKEAMGMEFPLFEQKWREFLTAKKLTARAGAVVRPYKVKEGKADEERLELNEIKSLVARNRTYLGDRLKEKGRPRAAVLEYRRALQEAGDSVPVLNRLSGTLTSLGLDKEAQGVLEQALSLDPDHPTSYTQLGQLLARRKDFRKAKDAFEEAVQINPFNPLVHAGLAEIYALLGDSIGAAKERSIAQKLRK